MKKSFFPRLFATSAAALALISAHSASAANRTWTGANATANLNIADNWDVLPVSTDNWTFNGTGVAGSTLNNDFSGFSVAGITYSAGGTAFNIGGNDITLTGNITNLSGQTQTIGLNMTLSGTQSIIGSTSGNTIITGNISGAGGITKTNSNGNLSLLGANTYTGQTQMLKGTLFVTSLNSVAGGVASSSLGAPTTVANGTIVLGTGAQAAGLNYSGTGETTD